MTNHPNSLCRALFLLAISCLAALGTTHYVSPDNPTAAYPFTSWATAAAKIQDAIDYANPGDVVLVTNGVYQTGGRAVSIQGFRTTNRVAITKALTVKSVNGPDVTTIKGFQIPGVTNGASAVRGVYLTNNAVLAGFTVTGCATTSADNGGGVWCASSAVVSNCVLVGNAADGVGGGAYSGTLYNCVLKWNWAAQAGGGAASSTLSNCTLLANHAFYEGGGAEDGVAYNSTFTSNSVAMNGGGASGAILHNCALIRNRCGNGGGGAVRGRLYNCTVVGNWSGWGAGGVAATLSVYNCLIYYNSAPMAPNYDLQGFMYSCTTPVSLGPGNIDAEPQLASLFHLAATSPCRSSGSSAYASGVDIDGDAWNVPASIGCDEYVPGAAGPLNLVVQPDYTNVAVGFGLQLLADISGRCTASCWDFGDGTVISNRPLVTHSWSVPGDYTVVLRGYNAAALAGLSSTQNIHVVPGPIHYANLASTNPVSPYLSWATAATNIQDAVDAVSVPGAAVLVGDGTYDSGGRSVPDPVIATTTNRLVVPMPMTVQSLHGAASTTILGRQAPGTDQGIRCVYLGPAASLVGFTLANGGTRESSDFLAAGVRCASADARLSNCIISSNSAGYVGGVCFGTLNNCVLAGNSATNMAGAAYSARLNNCTIIANSSGSSAVTGCQLQNSILYDNSGSDGVISNYDSASTLSYCCTVPLPRFGLGNMTNEPALSSAAPGPWQLQPNSPCINSGLNACAPLGTDLAGRPRIVAGTVDLGAYEYQQPTSIISYAWLQLFGLPADGSADFTDTDLDGMNNWQEWLAGTDPVSPLSKLALAPPAGTLPNLILTWQSVSNRSYFLQRSSSLAGGPGFLTLATNIQGRAGSASFTDTNLVGRGPFFYRVGVQPR